MMRTRIFLICIALCPSFLVINKAKAQEKIEKRVQVVKAYQPRIRDAYKISELPDITDTTRVQTEFDYYLLPRRMETEFEVKPIPAATMVGEPLTELYRSYFKVGMGHKIAPLVEFSLTSRRSKDQALGLFLRHHSSAGKVALADQNRVFAGYAKNHVRAFGKKFFDHAVLDGDLALKTNTRYFYGYDTGVDTSLNKTDIKQRFIRLEAATGFKSTYIDSAHLNYDFGLNYHHMRDRFESVENQVNFTGNLDKYYDQSNVGLDMGVTWLNREFPLDTTTNFLFHVKPWIARFGDGWRVQGGVNFYSDVVNGNANARFYPVASLEYDIYSQYFIPYAGVDGKVALNSYDRITQDNPFVVPGLSVRNTNYKMIFYAGIKGNLSSSVYYNTRVKYSFFDDLYFFVNDVVVTDSAANQFNVEYHDGELMNLYGELAIDFSDELRMSIEGNYYEYILYDADAMPWHKPSYDLTVSARYDLRDKIIVEGDLFVSGERWAKSGLRFGDEIKLDGYADVNLGLEYRYSKVLSGFLHVRNILSNNYSIWNNYPVYGLHAYLGITYAF